MSAGAAVGDVQRLIQRVLEKARAQAEEILEKARREAQERLRRAEEEAKEREEELVRAGLGQVERARRRLLSQAQLRLKGELLERKAAILEEVFAEVRRRLRRLRERPGQGRSAGDKDKDKDEYLELLVALVRSSLAGEGEPGQVRLYLSPDDLRDWGPELKEALGRELGLSPDSVELTEAGITGGVIVELPERRLQLDSSLEQLLREFRPQIEELVQEEIFAALERAEAEAPEGRGTTTR